MPKAGAHHCKKMPASDNGEEFKVGSGRGTISLKIDLPRVVYYLDGRPKRYETLSWLTHENFDYPGAQPDVSIIRHEGRFFISVTLPYNTHWSGWVCACDAKRFEQLFDSLAAARRPA